MRPVSVLFKAFSTALNLVKVLAMSMAPSWSEIHFAISSNVSKVSGAEPTTSAICLSTIYSILAFAS